MATHKILFLFFLASSLATSPALSAAHGTPALAFPLNRNEKTCMEKQKTQGSGPCHLLVEASALDNATGKILKRSDQILTVFSQPAGTGHYLVLIARLPSRTPQSTAYCGAGQEDHLILLEYDGKKAILRDDFLLQSCLKSVALDSDGSDGGDDILKALAISTEKHSIGFQWLGNPGDKRHTLTILNGKFLLN